jgi:hypothetical protein
MTAAAALPLFAAVTSAFAIVHSSVTWTIKASLFAASRPPLVHAYE